MNEGISSVSQAGSSAGQAGSSAGQGGKSASQGGKRIIVIGGGIAGLSAGIYARLAGYEVDVYEKNPVAGGQCMGWNRKGFHIDNCIHWLTGTRQDTSMYRVWKTVGALDDDTEYANIDAFYTSINGDDEVTLWNDLERTRAEMLAVSPEDAAEINKFIDHVELAKQFLFPAEKPMDMMGVRDYIKMGKGMKDVPKVMKEYAGISLAELAERFKHPVIKQMITDYMPKEYTANSFLVSYATMADGNGKVPMGGSLAMTNRIRDRLVELGGRLHLKEGVASVVVEGGKAVGVTLENGETERADYVISTIDADMLFDGILDAKYMPEDLKAAYADEDAYPIISGFQAAFAIEGGFPREGTVLFDCEPFEAMGREHERLSVKEYGYDPIYEKDGRTVIQCHICQGHDDYYYWKRLSKDEYEAKKQEYVDIMIDRIEKRFPETKGKIEFLDAWTPLTYERYCGAFHGSYMSFVTTPGANPLKSKGKLKGLKNFILSGQWTMPPGGLPVAASSGKFAVQRILKGERRDICID